MDVAKAAGSLRFRRAVVVGFWLEVDAGEDDNDAASDSESCSEEALESLFEEARSTAGNSLSDRDGDGDGDDEELWYCRCFRGFLDGRPAVEFALSSRLRF